MDGMAGPPPRDCGWTDAYTWSLVAVDVIRVQLISSLSKGEALNSTYVFHLSPKKKINAEQFIKTCYWNAPGTYWIYLAIFVMHLRVI